MGTTGTKLLESVDEQYRLVGEASVYRVAVEDPLTAQLAHAVRRFNDGLAARDGLEGEWGEVSRRASAAARGLWTVPLEASDELLRLAPTLTFLERWMRVAREVHGDEIAAALGEAVQALSEIVARASSPFREAVVAELRTSPDAVLVIRRGWAAPGVRTSLLADGLDVPVCTPSQLRGLHPVDLVCAVGVTRQLPPSLITAPHGDRVAFVHPSWMNDDEVIAGLFGEAGSLKFPIAWEPVPFGDGHVDDLESATDWTAIANQAPDEAEGGELVEALLMIVAGPRRVFLENERARTLDVVEPRAPQGSRVRREEIGQLEVGDFVLLRDHYGRDDSIRKMADQLLGPDGPRLRETQDAWKQGLRDAVEAKGYGQVSADLAAVGVKARNSSGAGFPLTASGPNSLRTSSGLWTTSA